LGQSYLTPKFGTWWISRLYGNPVLVLTSVLVDDWRQKAGIIVSLFISISGFCIELSNYMLQDILW